MPGMYIFFYLEFLNLLYRFINAKRINFFKWCVFYMYFFIIFSVIDIDMVHFFLYLMTYLIADTSVRKISWFLWFSMPCWNNSFGYNIDSFVCAPLYPWKDFTFICHVKLFYLSLAKLYIRPEYALYTRIKCNLYCT